MLRSALADITFDSQDANLFLVDDARLRADALKHSVVPRLQIVMNEAVALVRDIYGIDALEDSSFSSYPNFSGESYSGEILYSSAFVGLIGQKKKIWTGFSRWDRNPVHRLPFRLGIVVTEYGLTVLFNNGIIEGLRKDSYDKIFQFHIDNEEIVNRLCFESRMHPEFYREKNLKYFDTFKIQYLHRIKKMRMHNNFVGYYYKFPIGEDDLNNIISDFSVFFPVYDAYIHIAKGVNHRLSALVDELDLFYQETDAIIEEENRKHELPLFTYLKEEKSTEGDEENEVSPLFAARSYAKAAAAAKIPVMPAMRWQVFQRDGWKCVACGRTSHDGAILHVDHIVPRSKGGPDTLENFQTLCETCNIGKGNRDATDLRERE